MHSPIKKIVLAYSVGLDTSVMIPWLKEHTQLMGEKASSGYLDATRLLETLVMQGIPFREAHHQVGAGVAEAMEKKCLLADLVKL